jgi:gamma-glutamyltranspeptidase/glutathione hydrolase
VTLVYDFHMGSFQMCWRDEETGKLGATADPRRCGFANGIPA